MKIDLKEKRVFVTGSTSGIGNVIARFFLEEGCSVVLNGRQDVDLASCVDKASVDRAHLVVGNVVDLKTAAAIYNKVINKLGGGIDVLVCNVGSGASVPPGQETFDALSASLEVNLFSATNMVGLFRKELAQSRGSIICISSICGAERVPGAPVTYSAAKAALNSFISGVSWPLARDGIRINGIAPGNILFRGSTWERKLNQNADDVANMLQNEVALNRLGEPDEIARWAIWLASDFSAFSTGQVFVVDGGQRRGR